MPSLRLRSREFEYSSRLHSRLSLFRVWLLVAPTCDPAPTSPRGAHQVSRSVDSRPRWSTAKKCC